MGEKILWYIGWLRGGACNAQNPDCQPNGSPDKPVACRLDTLAAESGVQTATAYTEAFAASENDTEVFGQIRKSALKLGYSFRGETGTL